MIRWFLVQNSGGKKADKVTLYFQVNSTLEPRLFVTPNLRDSIAKLPANTASGVYTETVRLVDITRSSGGIIGVRFPLTSLGPNAVVLRYVDYGDAMNGEVKQVEFGPLSRVYEGLGGDGQLTKMETGVGTWLPNVSQRSPGLHRAILWLLASAAAAAVLLSWQLTRIAIVNKLPLTDELLGSSRSWCAAVAREERSGKGMSLFYLCFAAWALAQAAVVICLKNYLHDASEWSALPKIGAICSLLALLLLAIELGFAHVYAQKSRRSAGASWLTDALKYNRVSQRASSAVATFAFAQAMWQYRTAEEDTVVAICLFALGVYLLASVQSKISFRYHRAIIQATWTTAMLACVLAAVHRIVTIHVVLAQAPQAVLRPVPPGQRP